MRFAVLLALLWPALQAEPRLIYSKYFKGSRPESVIITIEHSGEATYREGKEDDNPLRFQLAESDIHQLFELARRLDHFGHPLESGLKVAHMGVKTFRFEDQDDTHEVSFNYSVDEDAKTLQECFERISESEQEFIELDRSMHFDKLGVNQALALIEMTYQNKRLIAPQQFLPLLDRVAKNESFLHLARARAASLAEAFRGGQSQP